MNRQNLDLIFSQYIERFEELNDPAGSDEGYKWRAQSCFLRHWDLDAPDFPLMFKSAMKELFNLIDNATVQPVGGFNMLLGHTEEIEFVRGCFRDLFADDGGDLTVRQARIIDFMNTAPTTIISTATA